jgi:CRISPR-associated protein Csx10
MNLCLEFEIVLESDYHVGAGQRAGLVDSALLRDHRRSPVLRGTTLAGLLCDAFEVLLKQTQAVTWARRPEEARNRLFGAPDSPKRWIYTSSYLKQPATAEKELRWGAQDVARVRVEPRTRRAAPQQLFTQEEGDSRLRFRFQAICPAAGEADRADAALLVAAARMVRHLGAARRRGRGQCRFELVVAEGFVTPAGDESWTEAGLHAFQGYWLEGQAMPSAPAGQGKEVEAANAAGPTTGQRRFRLVAVLREPLLVAFRSERANALESLPYVPGTAVLGALAEQAAHRLDLAGSPGDHALFTRLFVRGGVRVSAWLPAQPEGSRLYPALAAPRPLQQCENYPCYAPDPATPAHQIQNRLLDGEGERQCECGGKMETVEGFLALRSGAVYHQVAQREEIHIQMDPDSGRAAEANFFTYRLVEAGEWFVGELTCEAADWPVVQRLTGLSEQVVGELRLGKAWRKGHGLAHFVLEPLAENDLSPWAVRPLVERIGQPTDGWWSLSLLFLTDAIVADPWGRFYRSLDETALAALLGVGTKQMRRVRPFIRAGVVDSFNTHRRLPRWRDESILAGSAVGFEVEVADGSVLLARLEALEANGVGWRRQEGFGRVLFNHPLLTKADNTKSEIRLSKLAQDSLLDKATTEHELQGEARFRQRWGNILEGYGSRWEEVKAIYDSVARLIFLYRYRPLAEIKALLAVDGEGHPTQLGRPAELWGDKKLVGRSKEPRLQGSAFRFVHELLDALAKQPDKYHPVGLAILAGRLSEQAEKSRQEEEHG